MHRRGDADGTEHAMPLSDSLVFAGFFSKEKSPVTVQVTFSGNADGGSAAAIASGNINARSDAKIQQPGCKIVILFKHPLSTWTQRPNRERWPHRYHGTHISTMIGQ